MWSGKGNIFLSFCGGTFIFSLCKAIFCKTYILQTEKEGDFSEYEKQR